MSLNELKLIWKSLLLIFLTGVSLFGCALKPHPLEFSQPVTSINDINKQPAVEFVMRRDLRDLKISQRSFMTGIANKLEIPLGEDVRAVIKQHLSNYFKLVVENEQQSNSGYPSFEITSLNGDIASTDLSLQVKMAANLHAADGRLLQSKSLVAKGGGSLSATFFGGAFGASSVLTKSEHGALQDIINQMDGVINLAYQASPQSEMAAANMASVASRTAAQQGVGVSDDLVQHIPVGKKASRYDVAVIIGNGIYQADGVPDVDYATNDASIMKLYLEKTLGFSSDNILYFENATLSQMNQLFGSDREHRGKLFNFVKPKESRVFIYYVGHGAPDLNNGEAYFVPVDADPQYLSSSGYRLQTFYNNIAKLPAKDVTVVLDSCFSGGSQKGLLFKGISPAMVKVEKETVGPKNALIFTSGRNEQVSTWYPEKGHSLFTYYFLKGLQGEADQDDNKKLTVAEMDKYLTDNVPYMARRLSGREQNPSVVGGRAGVLAELN